MSCCMKRSRTLEMVSNLQGKFFALKVRRDGPQPSIFVRSFRSFTNNIKHAVAQLCANLFQFCEETCENLPLNGIGRDKVENTDIRTLPDAVNTPHTLLQSIGIPGNIVVDHQVAELEGDAFACRFGSNADLGRIIQALSRFATIDGIHPTVNLTGGVAPFLQVAAQVLKRVTMLCEDQQLAAPVSQLVKLATFDTGAQCFEF